MLVIGIMGGVASGKSSVAEYLKQLGAVVLDGDRIGHRVLTQPEVETALRQRFGGQVFGHDGHVDRAALAKTVFAPAPDGPEQLAFLEQLTHPRIIQCIERRLAQCSEQAEVKVVVLDAAVMSKTGWDEFCNKIIFVEAPQHLRHQRARSRGWSEEDFIAREAAQESLDVKRGRADVVIDNSGSPEHAQAQIDRFWRSLDCSST